MALYRRALRLFEGLAAEFPQVPEHRYSVFFMHHLLGSGVLYTGEEHEAHSRKALQVLLALHREAPANRVYREALATQYNVLGEQLRAAERSSAEAESYHRQAVVLTRALLSEDPKPSHLK